MPRVTVLETSTLFSTQAPGHSTHVVVDVGGYFLSTQTTYFTLRDPQDRLLTEIRATYDLNGLLLTPLMVERESVWFGNLLVGTYGPEQGWRYYASDHLRTPRLVTNDAGTTVATYKYRPYGEALSASPIQGTDFAAMERDGYSANHYDHARYYAGMLGRFQSPDKLGGQASDPQSWNRYSYARNNPLRFTDPTGLYVCDGKPSDCKRIAEAMAKLASAAKALPRSSRATRSLQGILTFYGNEGEKNGVTIAPFQATDGRVGGTTIKGNDVTVSVDLKSEGGVAKAFKVPVEAEVASTLAHEGRHGIDERMSGMPTTRSI